MKVNFSKSDLLMYLNDNPDIQKKTRKRIVIDKRNYIMAILHYHFKMTEVELASIFKKDRSSINHAKRMPYNLKNDKDFILYTENLKKKFPYTFPKSDLPQNVSRKIKVESLYDNTQHKKLIRLRNKYSLSSINEVLPLLIDIIDE